MTLKIARVISLLVHPVMMPLYVLVLLMNIGSFITSVMPLNFKLTLAGVVLLTTIVIPLLLTWMLRRLGIITSYQMHLPEERIYPILAISVFYYVTYFLLKGIHMSAIFSFYMLGCTLLAILALAINFFLKVSLHMIGVGSLAGLFLGIDLNFGVDLSPWIIGWILLGGITGFARLRAGTHRPAEIYAGFVAGTVVMTGLMLLI
jgi:hypothetical protein